MNNSWLFWLKIEFQKNYFQNLKLFLNKSYQEKVCLPPRKLVFRAFKLTPKDKIKVVILGQDPYHNHDQANGLAFSVTREMKIPKSLENIFSELKNNYPAFVKTNGDLTCWAQQGVFLLNTVLTVELNQPLSHQNVGWETFTDNVIMELNRLSQPVAFVLWGKKAQEKAKFLNNSQHKIFMSSHPSPYSAYNGFFGSRVFTRVNNFLITNKLTPINWQTDQ